MSLYFMKKLQQYIIAERNSWSGSVHVYVVIAENVLLNRIFVSFIIVIIPWHSLSHHYFMLLSLGNFEEKTDREA